MEDTNWLRQTPDKPLFPDLLWSRPENKRTAGKMLIVGGNSHSFEAVSVAYAGAEKAGIGAARVLLPDSLARALGKIFPEAEFAPSTPSGSFARSAVAQLMGSSEWADGVLLAGDFGRNSETAIMLESFIDKYNGPLTVAGDAVDYFYERSRELLTLSSISVVADLAATQKLLASQTSVKQSADLHQLTRALSSAATNCCLVTRHNGQIVVSSGEFVSTTPAASVNFSELAAYAGVWQLQSPAKQFEAITSSVYVLASQN